MRTKRQINLIINGWFGYKGTGNGMCHHIHTDVIVYCIYAEKLKYICSGIFYNCGHKLGILPGDYILNVCTEIGCVWSGLYIEQNTFEQKVKLGNVQLCEIKELK